MMTSYADHIIAGLKKNPHTHRALHTDPSTTMRVRRRYMFFFSHEVEVTIPEEANQQLAFLNELNNIVANAKSAVNRNDRITRFSAALMALIAISIQLIQSRLNAYWGAVDNANTTFNLG